MKVAVVTGANKGIGFAIVRGLCKKFDGDVYLTARDESRGLEAVEKLKEEGLTAKFHQLDVTDSDSIERLKEFLQKNYQGLDLLVNNAGMAFKHSSTASFAEQAEQTLKTNFWGTYDMCKQLFPILRSGARVVNISSLTNLFFTKKCTEKAKEKIRACKTMPDVENLMGLFVSSAKEGSTKEMGWPEMSYGMSKVGVTLLTAISQEEVDSDTSRSNILVNCCCPGLVDTDLTRMPNKKRDMKTIDEGAEIPLVLALLPDDVTVPRGEFYSEGRPAEWI